MENPQGPSAVSMNSLISLLAGSLLILSAFPLQAQDSDWRQGLDQVSLPPSAFQELPGAEIRARGQVPGHAGGSVPAEANIQRDLLASIYFLGKGKVHVGVRPLHNLGRC